MELNSYPCAVCAISLNAPEGKRSSLADLDGAKLSRMTAIRRVCQGRVFIFLLKLDKVM